MAAKAWYEHPLFIAFLGFVLGITSSSVTTWWQKSLEKSATAESIMVAFRGEVNAMRPLLRRHARSTVDIWQAKRTLRDYRIIYPKAIYDAHVARLGDVRDSTLAFQISSVYSMLEEANEIGRRIQVGTYGPEAFPLYVNTVVRAFDVVVHLDMRLGEQTKHIANPDWGSVRVGSQDAEDHNWAIGVMKQLDERQPRPLDFVLPTR